MSDNKITVQSVETNVLYMGVMALDLILRDTERRMRAIGGEFKYGKKMVFNRFFKAVKEACLMAERLQDDVVASTAGSSYKDYDVWLGEANELARLILLFADKSTVDHNSDAVFDRLESLDGEGIITEDVLQRFYLR